MLATTDREYGETILVDLSDATSSADALRHLEFFLESTNTRHQTLDLNTGELLLSPGVLARISTVVRRYANRIHTLYSQVPQTQQSALDEGFFVRRQPPDAPVDLPFGDSGPVVGGTLVNHDFLGAMRKSRQTGASRPKARIRYKASTFNESLLGDLEAQAELMGVNQQVIPTQNPEEAALFELLKADAMAAQRPTPPVVEASDSPEQAILASMDTLLVKQTLRSGQVLEADGHVILIGDAHSGSEIIAQGDIVVWGVIAGMAQAGSVGLLSAEIRALRIEAVQLRIGHLIARRPDRLFKHPRQGSGNRPWPEVARVERNEIQIFQEAILEKHL